MMAIQVISLFSTLVLSGVCANNLGLSYTDTLIDGLKGVPGSILSDKNVVNSGFKGMCHLDCPVGTQCSLEFGAPHCVSVVDTDLGSYLGNAVGLDLHARPILAHNPSLTKRVDRFGFHRCAPLTPACRATPFDRFEQCKFTFDLRLQRCVRVYVRNVCAIFDGPTQNLFSSRLECEHSCGRRLTY